MVLEKVEEEEEDEEDVAVSEAEEDEVLEASGMATTEGGRGAVSVRHLIIKVPGVS